MEVASCERFLTLVGEGLESQKEITAVMSPINKGTISRYATKAKSEGFLDDNLRKLRLSELGRLKYGS